MAEITLTLVIIGMAVLRAAVFVLVLMIGIRLAIGAPLLPRRTLRRVSLYVARLRSTVGRARHYHGGSL
jgi:hypothetical protein